MLNSTLKSSSTVRIMADPPYVSCDPVAWARDTARFEANGYQLEHAQPVNPFPQTYHVEVASVLHQALYRKRTRPIPQQAHPPS